MALRPGRRLEMSSHFIPLPRSSMIRASSSGDHLLCFLAGLSAVCGGMLRLTGSSEAPGTGGALEIGAITGGAAGAVAGYASGGGPGLGPVVALGGGTETDRVCCGGDAEDSFESGPFRSEAISTMTVSRLLCLGAAAVHGPFPS